MTNKEAYRLITALMDTQAPAGTKLEHARNQTLKNASSFIEAYNDKLEDLNIDYCSTDEKGNIVRDPRGQYIFTKDNQRALSKELKKFMDSEMIVPFEIVSTSDKKGLSDSQVEYLFDVGFIRDVLKVV
jgi:hypothetical protein